MGSVIDTIPAPLKKETISAFLTLYAQKIEQQTIALEQEFHFYDQLIREELEEYIGRKDLVSEVDVILEEQRIKRRIGEEFPAAKVLMEKFNDLTLIRRRGEFDIKQAFMAQNGTAEQFEALKNALAATPTPWWKGPA